MDDPCREDNLYLEVNKGSFSLVDFRFVSLLFTTLLPTVTSDV